MRLIAHVGICFILNYCHLKLRSTCYKNILFANPQVFSSLFYLQLELQAIFVRGVLLNILQYQLQQAFQKKKKKKNLHINKEFNKV